MLGDAPDLPIDVRHGLIEVSLVLGRALTAATASNTATLRVVATLLGQDALGPEQAKQHLREAHGAVKESQDRVNEAFEELTVLMRRLGVDDA